MPELDIFKKISGCSEFEDCFVVTINFYFIFESSVRYDESVLVNPDPNSKLHPNTKEQLQPRAELQAIMPRPPMFGGAGSGRPRKEASVMRNSPGNSSGGITPYSDLTGLQTVRKDQKVLRPMNAFMIWSRSYRKELISKG